MSVRRCKKEVSNREYLGWQAWFLDERNRPSRTDYYLMQIASVFCSAKGKVDLDKLRIDFKEKKRMPKPNKKTMAEWAKAKWFGITGYKRKDKTDGST